MKLLRLLFAITLVFALSRVARADDFKLGVMDAPSTDIVYTGQPLTVTFGSCGFGTPSTDGCVTILNDTGKTITNLVIDVPVDSITLADGGGNCLTGSSEVFTSCKESEVDSDTEYQFDFSGGAGIPDGAVCGGGDTFTIEEEGIPYDKFPGATLPGTVTPEPASIWLLASGVLLLGGIFYRRRLGMDSLGS